MRTNAGIRVYSRGVAIVTGGGSGIGKALSVSLARRGCEVVVADLDGDAADAVAKQIRSTGAQAESAQVDVTDAAAMDQRVRDTVERAGRLDFMFNNAGIGYAGHVKEHTDEEWRQFMEVNVMGVVHGVRAACRAMAPQGFGHIVNTSSMAGLMPMPSSIPYSMSKHAVVGLSVSLRARAAPAGIRVSVLCPGLVETPILKPQDRDEEAIRKADERKRWLPGFMKPMPADEFAGRCLDDVARNKAIVVYPRVWRTLWRSYRYCPTCSVRQATRRLLRTQRRLGITELSPSG